MHGFRLGKYLKQLKRSALYMITLFIAVIFCASASYAEPQASLQWLDGVSSPDGCVSYQAYTYLSGDGLILSITDRGRVILKKHYCSAGGTGDARIVNDAIGHHYLFVRYSHGHGTNIGSEHLRIYLLTNRLIEKEDFDYSDIDGQFSAWEYHYKVEKPRGGGLKLFLTLIPDGKPDAGLRLPPKSRVVIVDAAFSPIPAIGEPRASLDWNGRAASECQFRGDRVILSITEHGRPVVKQPFCAAFGAATAYVVTDAARQHYVFLEYASGHDNRSDYLKIYRLTDRLIEKANIDISYVDVPSGPSHEASDNYYQIIYNIQTPPGGGLKITLTTIPDAAFAPPDLDTPPNPRPRTIVIDPAQ